MLPKPPSIHMKDAQKFFEYWKTTDDEHPDRLMCYVYRTWPIIDRARAGKHKNIDAVGTPFDLDSVYQRYGSGDYKFILSDGATHKQVCHSFVSGFRDFHDYPVDIELEDIVMDEPGNRSWIQKMRAQGTRFEGDEPDVPEIDPTDDAATIAVRQLAAIAGDAMHNRFDQQPPEESLDTQLSSSLIKTVSEASKMSSKILTDAFETANKATEAAAVTQTPASNPVDQFSNMVTAIKSLLPEQPAAGVTPPMDIMPLVNLIMSIQDKQQVVVAAAQSERMKMMETMMEDLRQQRSEIAKPTDRDPLKEIERMVGVQRLLAEMNPASPGGPETPWYAHLLQALPLIAQYGSTIVGAIAASIYNRTVAKTGTGQPVPPPAPPPAPAPGMTDAGAGQLPPATPGATAPAVPGSPTTTAGDIQMYQQFLGALAPAIMTHINDPETTGADFADWLVRSQPNGQVIYMSMREMGKPAITQLIQSYEPLWQQLRQIPARLDGFLDEFLSYSEPEPVMEAEQEVEPVEPVEPVEMAAPAPVAQPVEPVEPLETLPPRKPKAARKPKKGVN